MMHQSGNKETSRDGAQMKLQEGARKYKNTSRRCTKVNRRIKKRNPSLWRQTVPANEREHVEGVQAQEQDSRRGPGTR